MKESKGSLYCRYFCSCCSACEYDGGLLLDLRNDADYLAAGVERPICNVFNPYSPNHKCEVLGKGGTHERQDN